MSLSQILSALNAQDILKELKAKKLVDKMLGKKSGSDLQKEPKGY